MTCTPGTRYPPSRYHFALALRVPGLLEAAHATPRHRLACAFCRGGWGHNIGRDRRNRFLLTFHGPEKFAPEVLLLSVCFVWRPRPESNRRARICSPLRHHSATWPILGKASVPKPI